jgi:hypothetical protein
MRARVAVGRILGESEREGHVVDEAAALSISEGRATLAT